MKKSVCVLLLFLGNISLIWAQFKPPRILKHPTLIRTERLNILNTTYRETNLNITPDGKYLFFMSGRGGQPWSVQRNYSGKIEHDGDIWYSQKMNGRWAYPRCLGPSVNTYDGEDEPNISPDGQSVIFQSWGKAWEDTGGPYYKARLYGAQWGKPIGLGGGINQFFLDTKKQNGTSYKRPDGSIAYYGTPHATDGVSVSADGKTFIVAAGADYEGNMDLYISQKNVYGAWSYLRRLGVSTLGDERAPFLAADGKTLYFASDGYGGWGGLDIFKTVLDANGNPGEVVNVGAPFNTWLDDYGLVLTANGDEAYFIREGDIYFANVEEASPELKPFSATLMIAGKITDAKTQRGTQAKIVIRDPKSNAVITQGQSNALTGEYTLVIPIEKNEFIQEVEKISYTKVTKNFKQEIKQGLNQVQSDVALQRPELAVNNKPDPPEKKPDPVKEKPQEAAASYGQTRNPLKEIK